MSSNRTVAQIMDDLTKTPEENRQLAAWQNSLIRRFQWHCCLNCDHWDSVKESCKKYNAVPPPRVIVVGCDDHEIDIPF